MFLGEYGAEPAVLASGVDGLSAFALARPMSPVSMAAAPPSGPTPAAQATATPTQTPGPTSAPPPDGALQRFNVPSGNVKALSADGSTVAFWSFARNLTAGQDVEDCPDAGPSDPCGSLYIYDVPGGTLERIPVGAGYGLGMANATALSADGRDVASATTGGAIWDGTMLLDREPGVVSQISTTGLAVDISADGRYVVLESFANNLLPDAGGGLFIADLLALAGKE